MTKGANPVKKIILLFTFLTLQTLLTLKTNIAQVTQEWVQRYPDTSSFTSYSNALVIDDTGNVFITGSSGTSTWMSFTTIKYSPAGTQQWVANYYGIKAGGRGAGSIAVDRFSNVYVTGLSLQLVGGFDYCTIKYNANGVQQWIQNYNGPVSGEDVAEKIAVDNAGNIYVSGYNQVNGGTSFAYTTIKYSTIGNLIWSRTYPGASAATYVTAMMIDDSCNVYITGGYSTKAVTIKYDSSGTQLWAHEYNGLGIGGQTWAQSLALDNSHNVYIAGLSHGVNTSHDYFTIKYSPGGVQQWVRRYNLNPNDGDNQANSIAIDNTGNIYVSGISRLSNADAMKLTTLKYTNSGDLVWTIRDSDTLRKQSTYMDIDKNNNVYVTGGRGTPAPYEAYLTIKYDNLGNEVCRFIYYAEDSISDPSSVKVDDKLNVYLTGTSSGNMCTVKYSQQVGLISNHRQIPKYFQLYQNYPNPFNATTKIRFDIHSSGFGKEKTDKLNVKCAIFNELGKEIAILVKENLATGIYEVEWDASNSSSGIYFYRLTASSYVQTNKMVLLK